MFYYPDKAPEVASANIILSNVLKILFWGVLLVDFEYPIIPNKWVIIKQLKTIIWSFTYVQNKLLHLLYYNNNKNTF